MIRHDGTAEHIAEPGLRRQSTGDQPTGERLRESEGLAAVPQQLEHHRLHRVVVEPEDDIADDLANPPLLLVENGDDLRFGRGLRGDPDLESLPSTRKKGDGGGAGLIEMPDLVVQLLREPRLGLPPCPQRAAVDHRGDAGPGLEIGKNARRHHLLHLPRHTGDRVDDLPLVGAGERTHETGRRTRHRRVERRTHGHVGLEKVVVRHLATTTTEHGVDLLDERTVSHEFDPHHLGDCIAGDVVLGRSEPAAYDHRVASIDRETQDLDHPIQIVADLGLVVAVDTDEGELLADPRRVRVDDLPEQQFGADRDHFTLHVSSERNRLSRRCDSRRSARRSDTGCP